MPKKFKKLFGATQGAQKMDLDELLGRLPKGTKAQQLEAELMFKRLQEEKTAQYAPTNPPTERGNAALREAQAKLRERGKQKFLEPSAEKRRMYHGTRHNKPGWTKRPSGEGIREFDVGSRGMTFVSPEPEFANIYGTDFKGSDFMSGAVYPVHVQARNPFDYQNADHLDVMTDRLLKLSEDVPYVPFWVKEGPDFIRERLRSGAWDAIEDPLTVEAAKSLGFDSMYMNESGVKNLGVFDPKRIKSAIGNQGTYDIENPDITKAHGGEVHMAGGGKVRKALRATKKASEATQDISQFTKAGKQLSLAERQLLAEHGLISNQAPAVIIPSKISNVEKAVRESKGQHGAKRVQRAADQIKNLERLYSEEALRRAFVGDNAKALMIMNPADFERFSAPLLMQEKGYPGSGPLKATLPTNEYINYLSGIDEFHDVPFLEINKEEQGLPLIPFISGHEGRHRSRAMAQRGEPAGLVQLLPRAELRDLPRGSQEEYLEALKKELEMTGNIVLPEKYFDNLRQEDIRRPAIELPDIYAEGGGVHMARGGKLFRRASNVGKGEKSFEAARNLMDSNRPLSLAERQFVAEMAAKQAEELARTRPQELASIETKGKAKPPSPKPARAKPKTKAEINAIAERVAPQMTGEFVRAKPGESVSVAGKSKKQFDLEQELQHDIQRSREVPEAKNIDLEPHRGSVMLSLPGDISIADYDIFGIGGEGLRMPSRQYGGPRFGLGHPEEAGWASGLVPAAGFQRRVTGASEQYGGAPVLANFMAMGPEGLNYAEHYADALLKLSKPEQMTPRNVDHFNKIIRSGNAKAEFPDFPGIEHPEASYLYMIENPEARKHYNSVMQLTKTTEELGLPSGLNVRHAVSEPELRDLERGMTGFSVMQMEPGVANLKPSMHPTYSHDIPGKFLGRTDVLMPYEMTFPDTVAGIRANPKQAASEFGTLQMLGGKQIIDNQLLDELEQYRRRIKELTGKKDGGVVHMGGGGDPGEVSGDMFKPKPFTIPQPLTDLADAFKRQFSKEKRTSQKPGTATDVILGGYVAPVLGAPSDFFLEDLGQMLEHVQKTHPLMRNRSVMDQPTSVVDKRPPTLPYEPKVKFTSEGQVPFGAEQIRQGMERYGLISDERRPLLELGTGIFAPFAAAKALKYGRAGAQALAPTAKDMLQMQLERLSEPTRSYVVKPEGGNWVQGSIEKYLDPLRSIPFPEHNQEGARAATALNNFVDKKLSKYMRNEMATPSDPLRIQADEWANKQTQLLADKQKQIDKARADMEKAQRERNVNPEVLTRSQARIRELEKEKALIENRSGLHYEPPRAGFQANLHRKNSKQLSSVEAKTEAGQKWEDVADASILGGEYRFQTPLIDNELYIRGSSADRLKAEQDALREIGGEFAVQNPDAMVNTIDRGFANTGLGWDHLIDELDNAMTPTSGLPKNLLLDPKTVDKMSVPQAVEHVDKINAWRASQKAEADAARAANIATVTHKEYPDAGLKWVELKVPELIENFKAPEKYEIRKPTPSSETFAIWDKEKNHYVTTGLKSEQAAAKHIQDMAGQAALEDALKYEGDMLSHCVGGYCPDVVSGRSRIFSLRDNAGRPHATIEVEPEARIGFREGEGPKGDEYYVQQNKYIAGQNEGSIPNNITFAEWWRSQNGIPEPKRGERISQIKGLKNRKPQDEYMPYVQDFVKSGDWSHIGDLHHTDLFKVTQGQKLPGFSKEIPPGYYTLDEFKRMAVENEMPQEILDNWMEKLGGRRFFGMKAGGAVHMAEGGQLTFAKANQMLQQYVSSMGEGAGMAKGGAVDYETSFNEMLQKHVQGMAEGGEVNTYDADPDVTDGGRFIQGPAFADGGAVKSIWTVN